MDKAKLLAERAGNTQDVDLPNGMGTVTVRALTRGEVIVCKKAAKDDDDSLDHHIMAKAMVSPRMTLAEVKRWMKVAPAGESVKVVEAIRDLSGLGEGAQKSGIREV